VTISSQPLSTPPGAILCRLESLGIRLGLESTGQLLASLGRPQLRFPSVLIAGSNGKGSTSSLLAAMATAAGYRTGLYTSPHLEEVEERLRIDGRAIAPDRLGEILQRIVSRAESEHGAPPTYFEALTVAAFLWLAEEEVELGVLEVGLGGRLDATNLADPLLSLITSIGLEHQEYLGDTLALIAREKAGILRPDRPALVWVDEPAAAAAIALAAREIGADLHDAAAEVEIEAVRPRGFHGQIVRLRTPVRGYELDLALPGDHQVRNLGLAVRAAEALSARGLPRLDRTAIERGVAACRWPGRIEVVEPEAPPPAPRRIVLDAAHNPGGAAVLGAFLAQVAGTPDAAPLDLLFGVLADKDAREMLAALAPYARRLVFTTPPSGRARAPEELPALLPEGTSVEAVVEPDVERALDRALAAGPATLVVCGSIFLVGEVRQKLRRRFGVPAAARDLGPAAV
jgi:dihydrofolate synthase / folylpolyglutamate synthase